nr:hypothetical protein [Tanacetum cinerariifolium]
VDGMPLGCRHEQETIILGDFEVARNKAGDGHISPLTHF